MEPLPPCQQTAAQMFESLTGFEEIAIRKAFGQNVHEYARKDGTGNPFMFGRALVFVHRRRAGDRDTDAYRHAMELPMRAALDYFAEDPDTPAEGVDLEDLEDDAEGKAPTP